MAASCPPALCQRSGDSALAVRKQSLSVYPRSQASFLFPGSTDASCTQIFIRLSVHGGAQAKWCVLSCVSMCVCVRENVSSPLMLRSGSPVAALPWLHRLVQKHDPLLMGLPVWGEGDDLSLCSVRRMRVRPQGPPSTVGPPAPAPPKKNHVQWCNYDARHGNVTRTTCVADHTWSMCSEIKTSPAASFHVREGPCNYGVIRHDREARHEQMKWDQIKRNSQSSFAAQRSLVFHRKPGPGQASTAAP